MIVRIKCNTVCEMLGTEWVSNEKKGLDAYNIGPYERIGDHSHCGDHPTLLRRQSCEGLILQLLLICISWKWDLSFLVVSKEESSCVCESWRWWHPLSRTEDPLLSVFSLRITSLPERNFSFASAIEVECLGFGVSIIWPVSHPGHLSTF